MDSIKGLRSLIVRNAVRGCVASALFGMAAPTYAWGPNAESSVVSAAGHLFSRGSTIPLTNLIGYIEQGSKISGEEEADLYLQFDVDPLRAIQREMFLLQGIKSERIDPYFAYRLGALGKKVVEHAAPMRDANSALLEEYNADIEKLIARVSLQAGKRNLVDPPSYFPMLDRETQANNQLIALDYRTGVGAKGIASGSLPRDVSLAIDAVADVWFTIFQSQVDFADISRNDMRDYMLDSINFYLKARKVDEVNDVYARAREKGLLDDEMKQTIGDLYYDNEYFAQALGVYDELLAVNPRIQEVNSRIAGYYVSVGKKSLGRGDLEAAQASFQDAVNADSLSEDAQRQLVTTTREIEKRDARFAKQQDSHAAGERAEMEAESADQRRDYARAIQYLHEAQGHYAKVDDEFEELSRAASVGRRNVEIQLQQMKGSLVTNAQLLSGSGFVVDAKALAATSGDLSRDALKSILQDDYRNALEALSDEIVVD
jgi:tetratricopeptide (TPR) repeat protein